MRIEAADLTKSVEVLRELGAMKIWLFGSALETPENVGDIDLACEGLPDEVFYHAIGQLIHTIGKPVDLVDLSGDTRFNRYVRSKARLLYDGGRPV